MRRRHPQRGASQAMELGVAWYTREGWERLREIADDPDALDESFEAWERQALSALAELQAAGHRIRKVPIDIEALVAWCRDRQRRLDSAARAEYVSEVLQQQAQPNQTAPDRPRG